MIIFSYPIQYIGLGSDRVAVPLAALAGYERVTGKPDTIGYGRVADNPGAISFCLNLEFHAKIAE